MDERRVGGEGSALKGENGLRELWWWIRDRDTVCLCRSRVARLVFMKGARWAKTDTGAISNFWRFVGRAIEGGRMGNGV